MSTLRTSSFHVILDAPVRIVRQHWRQLLPVVLLAEAVAVAPFTFQQIWLYFSGTPTPDDPSMFFGWMAAIYGIAGIAWLVKVAVTLVVYKSVQLLLDGERLDAGRLLGFALHPKVFLTVLLKWLPITIGMCLCGVPGAIMAVLLALVQPVMAHEELHFGVALRRSWDMALHNPSGNIAEPAWVRALLIGVIFWLMSMGLSWLAMLPSSASQFLNMFRAGASGVAPDPTNAMPALWASLLSMALLVGTNSLVKLYLCGALTVLYRDTHARMEGRDLQAALQERLDG
jgi:hypothetical protein